ncbi:MAG: CRTAC1 family protein [Geminicoccaceae bacterium]|nr:CRTAC1 family protein [Geminicoccaceae bacterium]
MGGLLTRIDDALEGCEIASASALALADLGPQAPLALVVGVRGGPNRLLLPCDGRLVAQPLTELCDPFGLARAIAAADLDGDGIEEIWIANGDPARPEAARADRLFDPSPGGFRDRLAEAPLGAGPGAPSSTALLALDRSGSGLHGFLLAAPGRPIRLIESGEAGEPVDRAAEAGLDELIEARVIAQGPAPGSGLELFAGAGTGPSAWFAPAGPARFADRAETLGLLVPDLGAVDAAFLDADGTGAVGLFCLRRRGAHLLWVRDQAGLLHEVAPPGLARPSPATALLVADLDNDGFEEILIANAAAPNRLLGFRERGWRPLDPGDAMEPASQPVALAAADLDGCGRLELVIARASGRGGGLALYRVEENEHAWIRIAPRSPRGAPARGALVRLWAGGRQQWRIVGGSRGNGEPVAHFGLGACERVERVDIRWPDGSVRRLVDLEARQTITVPHPRAAAAAPGR